MCASPKVSNVQEERERERVAAELSQGPYRIEAHVCIVRVFCSTLFNHPVQGTGCPFFWVHRLGICVAQ